VGALVAFFRSSNTATVYICANKAQKWAVTSWVPGFISLPGHVMAGTATKKPQLHVNIIPEQVVGSTNYEALLQAVLSASLDSYPEKPFGQAWQSSWSAIRREQVAVARLWIRKTCHAHDQLCGEATHTAWSGIISFCAQILDNYAMEKDTNFIQGI